MRSFSTDLVHVFLSLPFYSVCVLAGLSIAGFRSGRASPLSRWRYWLASAAALYYVASTEVVGNLLVAKFEAVHRAPAFDMERSANTTILVLSAGWPQMTAEGYRAYLGADGFQRVMTGVELWRRIGGKLLFSGAPTPELNNSMAHEMARLASALGVPKNAILIEPLSRNTYENLVFSRKLLREAGRSGGPIVMVVGAFLMPRAAAVARRLEMEVTPYPCAFEASPQLDWRYWIPSNDGAQKFESILHEFIGLGAYWWRGWI